VENETVFNGEFRMQKKDLPLGIVLYEGPSLIDRKPIVVIANSFKKSGNEKTGQMIQTWILRKDMHPQDAIKSGGDYSICGRCKHRHFRSCYVNVMHGPSTIWRTYKKGRYNDFTPDSLGFFADRNVRLGAYGDPAAVPASVWATIISVSKGHTGYTHRWKHCDPTLKYFCMASVDTPAEYEDAVSRGWRTFRVRVDANSPLLENEIVCPASAEAGHKTDCNKCGFCSGVSNRKNPCIIAHGWKHKVRYFAAGIKKIIGKRKYATAICGD
jgi:hypothetical protein